VLAENNSEDGRRSNEFLMSSKLPAYAFSNGLKTSFDFEI